MHAHTLASDGMVSTVDLAEAAAAIGLSVVCVTDHDTIAADFDAGAERAGELGIELVRGEEVTTRMNPFTGEPGIHVVGLFLDRAVRQGMTVEDTVDAIHDEGGLAVLPHPFAMWYFASIWPKRLRRLLDTHAVDGIELRHRVGRRTGNWKELDHFYSENRESLGAALGAGDSHYGIRDIGNWTTAFPGKSASDLRAAIENATTSPAPGVAAQRPPLTQLAGQQVRSMIWLNAQRRKGAVGRGVGPRRAAPTGR